MILIRCKVEKQTLKSIGNYKVKQNSKNYVYLNFHFCDDWNNANKLAVFTAAGIDKPYEYEIVDNTVKVPDVCAAAKSFTVSVVGYDTENDIRIPTNEITINLGASGYLSGEEPPAIEPDVYEQILKNLNGKLNVHCCHNIEDYFNFITELQIEFSSLTPVWLIPMFDDGENDILAGSGIIVVDSGSGSLDDAVLLPMSYSEAPLTADLLTQINKIALLEENTKWKILGFEHTTSGISNVYTFTHYGNGASLKDRNTRQIKLRFSLPLTTKTVNVFGNIIDVSGLVSGDNSDNIVVDIDSFIVDDINVVNTVIVKSSVGEIINNSSPTSIGMTIKNGSFSQFKIFCDETISFNRMIGRM